MVIISTRAVEVSTQAVSPLSNAGAASWGNWEARYAIFPNSQGVATYPGWEITFPSIPAPNPYRKKKQ